MTWQTFGILSGSASKSSAYLQVSGLKSSQLERQKRKDMNVIHFSCIVFTLYLSIIVEVVEKCEGHSMRSEVNETKDGVSVGGGSIPSFPGTGQLVEPLEQLVLKSFNNLKNVMLAGNSGNGLPILDPLVIPFSIPLTFPNPICGVGTWQLVLSKLTFIGLSMFTVRSLDVKVGSMSYDLFIANMSATCAYNLNYYLTPLSPAVPVCSGTAYGSIVGADFSGSAQIFSTAGNWFNLASLTMTFGFQNFDIRIYPNLPLVDPTIQSQIENMVYDAIQKMKPNISNLTHLSYTKTVSLNLGSLP